jgi:RNA polymerase sigma-70 factor, ECF subfamily
MWVRLEGPTAAQREVARRYVEALERRAFAALAAFVRIHARFSFPPRCLVRRLDDKHAAPGEHLVLAATANLQPAVAVYPRAPGEPRYRPLALSVLRIEHGRVVEVIDLGRPELFELFGLPMSFARSRRSNEDEVNPKEVR